MTIKYIVDFFNEKEIPFESFEVESENGTTNFIDNTHVIEQIKQCSVVEQRNIANVLRKIDFMNGNVNHFLKHLAGAMALDI